MKKIPTLFVRDENNRQFVTDEVTPGCEWVLAGEGVATRKYDGTCVMFDGEFWYGRREVKKGKSKPPNFIEVNYDPITEKRMGWEPIAGTSFYKFFKEALEHWDNPVTPHGEGTYELCGPKINGNPEGLTEHVLIKHELTQVLWQNAPDTVEAIKAYIPELAYLGYEGVVWHHPDGRMAKLKVKDYPK